MRRTALRTEKPNAQIQIEEELASDKKKDRGVSVDDKLNRTEQSDAVAKKTSFIQEYILPYSALARPQLEPCVTQTGEKEGKIIDLQNMTYEKKLKEFGFICLEKRRLGTENDNLQICKQLLQRGQ